MYSTIQLPLEHIHVTFEGKSKYFREKWFAAAQEWTNKSSIELIASYICTRKNWQSSAITFKSHNGSWSPWKNNQPEFFCVRQVYCTKSCEQIWVRVNNPLYHLHITSEVKQYYGALFLSYRSRTQCSISKFCGTNSTHSIFRTIEACVGF